jgi:hypothetical protein
MESMGRCVFCGLSANDPGPCEKRPRPGESAATTEFVVELMVVVDAPTHADAERYGEQLAGVIRQKASERVKNVLVTDVRGEDE